MKPSYFTTPRTLDDATFYAWGAAVQRDVPHKMDWQDKLIVVAGVFALVALAIIVKVWG